MADKATSSIQVIARVARLLDTLAVHDEPVSLKTLSTTTGLHPSTAFRILALQLGDRVHRRPDSRRQVLPLAMDRRRDLASEPAGLVACEREP